MPEKKVKEVDILLPDNEETDEEAVIVVEEVVEEPLRTITPMRDFRTRIAGVWMDFYKDKPVKVSAFVEEMLRKDKTKLYK